MKSTRQHYLDGFLASTGRTRPGASPSPVTAVLPPEAAPDAPDAPLQAPVSTSWVAPSPAPLSWEEEVKQSLFPYDAFPRLLTCATLDRPPDAADRFRFGWFGLLYQGPDQDAFVLRTRLPGGVLKVFQLLALADLVQEVAGGIVTFNAQGGLDLPGIPVRNAVEALRRLEAIGLSARGTAGDCVRAVRGGETEFHGPADAAPFIFTRVRTLEQWLAQSREAGDLPGPCEILLQTAGEAENARAGLVDSADGPPRIVLRASVAAPLETPSPPGWPSPAAGGATWHVLLPGCGDLGVALPDDELVPFCAALLRVWSRQADRGERAACGLAAFSARTGVEGLRGMLERELGRRLAPATEPSVTAGTTPEATAGSTAMAVADELRPWISAPVRRLLSAQLVALAGTATLRALDALRFIAPGCLVLPPHVDVADFAAILSDEGARTAGEATATP